MTSPSDRRVSGKLLVLGLVVPALAITVGVLGLRLFVQKTFGGQTGFNMLADDVPATLIKVGAPSTAKDAVAGRAVVSRTPLSDEMLKRNIIGVFRGSGTYSLIPADPCDGAPDYVLRFAEEDNTLDLVVTRKCKHLRVLRFGDTVSMRDISARLDVLDGYIRRVGAGKPAS